LCNSRRIPSGQTKEEITMTRTFALPTLIASLSALTLTPASLLIADGNDHVTFTTIDFPGATATQGRDVTSDAGAYVGEYDDVAGHHGFVLQRGSFTSIDVLGAISTDAHGMNSHRDVVGLYRTPDGQSHGYLLSPDGLMSFDAENSTGTSFMGINDRGDIVGGWCDGTIMPCPIGGEGNRGFVLSDGQFTSIDFPGATLSQAWKINSHSDIVGSYQDTSGLYHGFLWRDGVFTAINFPGAERTFAFGINDRGDIVGSYCNAPDCSPAQLFANNHAFLLSGGDFASFDFPGGAERTVGFAINAHGDIAGTYRDAAGRGHGFLISKGEDEEDEVQGRD
jgi:uncharacterized membrane protein